MFNYHPKLIMSTVEQTPRAMIAMIIVSCIYVWIFFRFIPSSILFAWFFAQIFLAAYRLNNAKKLRICIRDNDVLRTKEQVIYFFIANIFQALMWTSASILSVMYAPQPFELVNFVLIIGIITAAALSMSPIFYAYLIFFFLMIIPQIGIMLYYGEHQHMALTVLSCIFIPAIILLSKSIYDSTLSAANSVDELHKLSITDSLTDLYNRRYFFVITKNLISISLRKQTTISLLMIDIDYFKKINDTYGHHAGDFILVSFSKYLKGMMRESDICARVGGEEFTVLVHDATLEKAKLIAEKIRIGIENETFAYNGTSIDIKVSIGVAELNLKNPSVEELHQTADKQLYMAKKTGRNRVC